VAPGRAAIIAVAGLSRDTTRIVVRPAEKEGTTSVGPASLAIAIHEPLRVGDTATLALTALDRRGKPVRPGRVTWSSSEPQVAEVHSSTGRVRAHAAGTTLLIARSGSESAMTSLTVLPAAVSSVAILGARPLKVGDTVALRAEPKDFRGRALEDRRVDWVSSEPEIAAVDSAGVVIAAGPGSTEITASAEGRSGSARITILPQPRTSRAVEMPADNRSPQAAPTERADPAAERQRVVEQMAAGVERCYAALLQKDVAQVKALYRAETKSDDEKLSKLSRILRTREWAAEIGERKDGVQRIQSSTPSAEFSFRLSWKDAFGGRLTSYPVFRAEFTRGGDNVDLSSCRIVGSPKL